jgi:hypothetical protein
LSSSISNTVFMVMATCGEAVDSVDSVDSVDYTPKIVRRAPCEQSITPSARLDRT